MPVLEEKKHSLPLFPWKRFEWQNSRPRKKKSNILLIQFFKFFVCMHFFLYPLSVLHESYHISTPRRLGVLPEKLGGGVRSASQNPCAIYEKICNVRYPIYDLTKNSKDPGAVSRKARKLIRLEKLFLVNPFSKTEMVCTPETSCMNRTSVRIKNM